VISALVVLLPFVSAGLLAASARLASLSSSLLVGYLAFVTVTVGAVLALSPARQVNADGLLAIELAIVVVVAAGWWLRGRPGLPIGRARVALRAVVARPETAAFFVFVIVLLAYELLLALTVPANNWDSLTYHLVRAAAWVQHGGVYWIPNAPTDRINEFQPLAEQEILYLFAGTGSGALFAVPQFLAELAILAAVYGSARRLGFEARASACAMFLLATFSLIALESSTAQNDLVAASFPVAAACLLLGRTDIEAALAGVAVAYGLGAKLTTALVLPVLLCLALLRGRRAVVISVCVGLVAILAVGMWGFVLNDAHTGHLLGHGGGRVNNTTSPSWPASAVTALDLAYTAMDDSVMSGLLIDALAIAGVVAGIAVCVRAARRRQSRRDATAGLGVGLALAAPLLVICVAWAMAAVAGWWGHPIRGPDGAIGGMVRVANEDRSAFGPIGSLLLLGLPVLAIVAFARRRADARLLALGLSVPCFVTLLVLASKYNAFLSRFLVVPVVLAAPVMALLFRRRAVTTAIAVVASIAAGLTIAGDEAKRLSHSPWRFGSAQAVVEAGEPVAGAGIAAFERFVPAHACVGAIFGADEPAYPLYGPRFEHRVEFLQPVDPVRQATLDGLFYVVINGGFDRGLAKPFRQAGWRTRPLGGYWILAWEPDATSGRC
jgi:Glycosyltransferase family 87